MKLESLAHWAEILASVAVVASLVFLTFEIRGNTRALEGQSIRERSAINDPFIASPLIPEILAKIKAVDGPEPGELAFMERYSLSYEEASIFGRLLARTWTDLEAEFVRSGPSQGLQDRVQLLLTSPDNQLFWDVGAIQVQDASFRAYVASARSGELPLSDWVSDYGEQLESLRANGQ